jgi:plastocyanin
MLIWISIALIIGLSSYVTFYTFRSKNKLTCMAGMMIAMTNSMISSIALGTILGISFNLNLSFPTIVAVSYGMLIGYLTGKPISTMAALDGLGAGVMGGMMGAMFGVMLVPEIIDITILFILTVFIIVVLTLLKMMEEELQASNSKIKKPIFINPSFLIMLLLLISIPTLGKNYISASSNPQEDRQLTPASTYTGDAQVATVNVIPSGYGPSNITVKAGEPVVINFKADNKVGCLLIVNSTDLGIKASLVPGSDNFIDLGFLEPGVYSYSCSMNMYQGTITVQSA